MTKKITKKMLSKIKNFHDYFYSKTIDGHIINYLNGFVGVGILERAEDHLTSNSNTLWIYGCGFTSNGKDIEENQNVLLTEDEGEDLLRCLKIALSKHFKYYKKLTKKQLRSNCSFERKRI